jgi:hypothetical protein
LGATIGGALGHSGPTGARARSTRNKSTSAARIAYSLKIAWPDSNIFIQPWSLAERWTTGAKRKGVAVDRPFVRFLWFRPSSGGLRTGIGMQVGAQHPPPYPPAEAFLALIPAAAQLTPAFHHADAPLDARPEPSRSPKQPLPLVALALLVLGSLLGQRYSSDPHASGGLFVGQRLHSAVRRHQPRRAPEQPLVVLQAR